MGRNIGLGDICIKLLSVQRHGKTIKENGRDKQLLLTQTSKILTDYKKSWIISIFSKVSCWFDQ